MAHDNGLRLIDSSLASAPRGEHRRIGLGLALLVFVSALAGTFLGADATRSRSDPREAARLISLAAMDHGSSDPQVRADLTAMRLRLGRSPLDSRTRVAYSGLLLGLGRSLEQMEAAAHHARLAARLSPVTVSVNATAAQVLARSGYADQALLLVREMFGYDREAAARCLAQIEPLIPDGSIERGIPDAAPAWLAWAQQLRVEGRPEEAIERVEQALVRWSDDVATLIAVSSRASNLEDWDTLERVLPSNRELPRSFESAALWLHRARLRAVKGDDVGARADLEQGRRLDDRSTMARLLAGEVYSELGDVEQARRAWNRALFGLPSDADAGRGRILLQLARLEDRQGRPASALHMWESLLELEPGHAEARRRVDALSGNRR